MAWTDKLEARYGKYAIPGIVRGIVILQILVYLLLQASPAFKEILILNPAKVMQGEVWRLVTYIFLPREMSLIFVIFALYILWMVGNALEEAWGAFKLNLYVLTGVICMTVASLLFGAGADGVVFYTSIFFAFATVYPNFTFLLFFILPVKVKWLAFISAGFLALQALGPSGAARAAAAAIVVNYLLFFGEYWVHYFKNRAETKERRARFDAARLPEDEALHRCKICNRTENDPADLDFRVAPDGEEYCTEHLPAKK